jgi:hypothetical protein
LESLNRNSSIANTNGRTQTNPRQVKNSFMVASALMRSSLEVK